MVCGGGEGGVRVDHECSIFWFLLTLLGEKGASMEKGSGTGANEGFGRLLLAAVMLVVVVGLLVLAYGFFARGGGLLFLYGFARAAAGFVVVVVVVGGVGCDSGGLLFGGILGTAKAFSLLASAFLLSCSDGGRN